MITYKNKRRFLSALLLLALVLCLLAGCGVKESTEITSLDQLAAPGTKIGVPSDMLEFETLQQDYPEAEVLVYDDYPLAYGDVAGGRLDAYVYARSEMQFAIENGTTGVRLLGENYSQNTIAVGLSPVSPIEGLQEKINAFIAEMKADGTLDDMYTRWVLQADDAMPEIVLPEHPTYHLRVGTTGTVMPYSYYVGTELRGYDIELAYRFAAWLGADIEFKIYDFGGIVAAASVGDIDCIMSNLYLTPEKEESIPFSDPLFDVEITAMVRDTGAAAEGAAGEVHAQDFNGKKLAVLVGPLMEDIAHEYFPDSEYLLMDGYPECIAALLAGKVDGYLGDEVALKAVVAEQPEISYIPEYLSYNEYNFAFRKDDPASDALRAELNTWLSQSWTDGTMQEIDSIWFGTDEARKVVELPGSTGENGTIRVVTTSTDMPFSYIKDGKNVGYDIDVVARFCRARGYGLELVDVDFAARIPTLQSGKADFTTSMNVTPERMEEVNFCDLVSSGGVVLAVRASDLTASTASGDSDLQTLADLDQAAIGVLSGTNIPELVAQRLPDAEILYYNSTADEVNALKNGKIDAVAIDEPVGRNMMAEDAALATVPELLDNMDYAFALNKDSGEALCAELSEYLRSLKADGTLAQLQEKWFDSADLSTVEMTDYRDFPAENGTVRVAAFQYPPFILLQDDLFAGYEIELLAFFCRDRGYALEIADMSADAVLPSVQSGKCDVGCCCISVTEERKESVLFSEPHYSGGTALLVRRDVADAGGGFLSSVKDSFEKTFLRENRWKLFLQGIGTTMLITVLSIIFGTALGFGAFMLCRNGNPVANTVTRFCVWLVQGMPVVVLLMILYYIIFGKVAISGAAVSVVGFTLVFGAAVYAMLKSGVGAIDRGQTEAAYTLGYTDRKAFYRVVLPQALPHFMPAYKGEITALIKATAVVGYVAVQDLTKMGDIVRSRTYEAFFPLIAVAVIYFILAAILTFIVNKLELRIDPRRRSKESILKGVDVK